MRSSKSRSRNKSNRQRSLGNIVNRVFDSSGPEGKVRGTPQQIIDKYLMLARDAQLSNDRVAEQSFLQHAEHYTRMLSEAQREQAERQQQNQGRHNNGGNDQNQQNGQNNGNNQGQGQNNSQNHNQGQNSRHDNRQPDVADEPQPNIEERSEPQPEQQPETPKQPEQPAAEAEAPKKRAPRTPRRTTKAKDKSEEGGLPDARDSNSDEGDTGPVETPETAAAEEAPAPAPVKKKRTYTRRKPKASDEGSESAKTNDDAS